MRTSWKPLFQYSVSVSPRYSNTRRYATAPISDGTAHKRVALRGWWPAGGSPLEATPKIMPSVQWSDTEQYTYLVCPSSRPSTSRVTFPRRSGGASSSTPSILSLDAGHMSTCGTGACTTNARASCGSPSHTSVTMSPSYATTVSGYGSAASVHSMVTLAGGRPSGAAPAALTTRTIMPKSQWPGREQKRYRSSPGCRSSTPTEPAPSTPNGMSSSVSSSVSSLGHMSVAGMSACGGVNAPCRDDSIARTLCRPEPHTSSTVSPLYSSRSRYGGSTGSVQSSDTVDTVLFPPSPPPVLPEPGRGPSGTTRTIMPSSQCPLTEQ
mmetsp:Transcript_16796/g.50324  ORF Transcript_16796/g.50324 Transcript_16796/m.50324 type:complete len:323 (+) Transcript_16796:835-1803(+)